MFDEWKSASRPERPYETKIPQQAEYSSYSTGTSRPPAPKRTGLFILLSLLVILFCVIVSLLVSLKIQLNGRDIQTALSATDSGEPNPVQPDALPEEQENDIAIPAPDTIDTGTVSKLTIDPVPQTEPLTLQQVYQKVIPSVVSIVNTTYTGETSGTGIIMTADGYLITNAHVVENSSSLQVLLQDNSAYNAALVGSDETSDLAVLKIDATDLTPARFGNSDALHVGDEVVAIGDPLGTQLRGTMTNGIISAINRDLVYDGRTLTLIQTNAALNSGNSGGPLINMYGQVIGINTMKISTAYTSSSVEGLGFAIPISSAREILDELLTNGYVSGRPAIGIVGDSVPLTAQAYYRLPSGVIVRSIDENSDAYAKGLREGDIITSINDTPVSGWDELNTIKNQYRAGDSIRIVLYRAGQLFQLEIVLMDAAGVIQ